jgi:hypothetical protein
MKQILVAYFQQTQVLQAPGTCFNIHWKLIVPYICRKAQVHHCIFAHDTIGIGTNK